MVAEDSLRKEAEDPLIHHQKTPFIFMAENSKIEWCDSTFNPVIGCEKISPGCAHCYAEVSTPVRTARAKGVELWGKGSIRQRTSAANWKQPMRWNKQGRVCVECATPILNSGTAIDCKCGQAGAIGEMRNRRVFCASLSDWLDEAWPIEVLADLLKLIHDTPNLDWLLLTKRPENWYPRLSLVDGELAEGWIDCIDMPERGAIPQNVWIGTTVEDRKRADERIPGLLKIPAQVRFLSVEPQLEAITLRALSFGQRCPDCKETIKVDLISQNCWCSCCVEGPEPCIVGDIHWIINGFESGPKKRPGNTDWMRSLRDECRDGGIRYFCKQIDKIQPIPADLMIREFPV